MLNKSVEREGNLVDEISISTDNSNYFTKNRTVLISLLLGVFVFFLYTKTHPIGNPKHLYLWSYSLYTFFTVFLFLILKGFDRITITKFERIKNLYITRLIILIISFILSFYLAHFFTFIVWLASFAGTNIFAG